MSIINRLKVFSPIPVQYLKANLGIFPFLFQNPNYLKYINLLLPDVVRGDPEATGSLTFEHHIVEVIIQNIPNYDKDMYFFSLFSFLHLIFKNLRREDLYVQINEIPLILLPLEAIHQYIQTKTNTVLENILDLLDDIINYWNDSLSIILPPEFIAILLKITEKPFEIDKLGNGNLLMQLLKVWNRCILSFIKFPDCEKLVITLLNILVGHVKAIPFKYQHLMPSVMPKILLIFSNIAFYKETAEYLLKSDAFTFLLDNYQNMQFDMKESFLFIFCNAAINWPDIVLEKCDFISLVNDCLDLESNNKKFLCVLMKTIYAIFNYDNSTLEIIDIDEIKEFLERFIDSDDNELYTLSNKIMDDFLSESEEEVPDKLFLQ